MLLDSYASLCFRAGIASVMLKLTPWSAWAKAAHNIVYGIHLTTNLR
jgi:hypothetical protein